MAREKRAATTSVKGQIEMTRNLMKKLEPAYELNALQQSYFNRIIRSRETSSWDENHILIATNLAVNYAQLDAANEDIAERGLMTKSDRGTPVVNPAVVAKTSLTSGILQMNKALGLSASQMGSSSKTQDARNTAERQAREVIETVSDDLI